MNALKKDEKVSAARSLAGQIGALTRWAYAADPCAELEPARRGFRARFERMVDPDGLLDLKERERRASRLMKAHMKRLAARSAEVRRMRVLKK